MAPPDKKRQGSEKGQREHSGPTTEKSDAGMQTHSQGARGGPAQPSEAPTGAPDAGLADPAERAEQGKAQRQSPPGGAASGQARDLEGRGAMAERGLEATGGHGQADTQRGQAPKHDRR